VTVYTQMQNTSSSQGCQVSFSVDGAAASDATSLMLQGTTGIVSPGTRMSGTFLVTGLTAGSHTFNLDYKTVGGGTCSYDDRTVTVLPY
jgi:ATP-dependent protease ClpP protease subunit